MSLVAPVPPIRRDMNGSRLDGQAPMAICRLRSGVPRRASRGICIEQPPSASSIPALVHVFGRMSRSEETLHSSPRGAPSAGASSGSTTMVAHSPCSFGCEQSSSVVAAQWGACSPIISS